MGSGKTVMALGILSVLAAMLATAAVFTPAWLAIDSTVHVRRGLFLECTVAGRGTEQSCTSVSHDALCHDSFTSQFRDGWAIAMGILSVLSVLAGSSVCVFGWCYYRLPCKTSLFFNLLSCAAMTACTCIVAHTYDGWYYCNMSYCDYAAFYLGVDPDSCLVSHGYSFTLAIAALTVCLLCTMLSATLTRAVRRGYYDPAGNPGVRSAKHKLPPPPPTADPQPLTVVPPNNQASEANAVAAPPPFDVAAPPPLGDAAVPPLGATQMFDQELQEIDEYSPQREGEDVAVARGTPRRTVWTGFGDWVYDPLSKYYWSATEYLYLDPHTQHYYDPHSRKWFDPIAQRWYD